MNFKKPAYIAALATSFLFSCKKENFPQPVQQEKPYTMRAVGIHFSFQTDTGTMPVQMGIDYMAKDTVADNRRKFQWIYSTRHSPNDKEVDVNFSQEEINGPEASTANKYFVENIFAFPYKRDNRLTVEIPADNRKDIFAFTDTAKIFAHNSRHLDFFAGKHDLKSNQEQMSKVLKNANKTKWYLQKF